MSGEFETAPYELGPADHEALTRQLAKGRPPVKVSGGLWWLLGGAVLTVVVLTLPNELWERVKSHSLWVGIGAVLPTLAVGVMMAFLQSANRRAVREAFRVPSNRWLAGPWRTRVGPEGLTLVSAYITQHIGWEVVWHIGEDEHAAYFLLTTHTGHVVPRSVFKGQDDFKAFVHQSRRLREDADRVPRALEAPVTRAGVHSAGDTTGTKVSRHGRDE